jgi:UDP-N-acetylglucosamine enolpyruvyl transferase
VTLRFYDPAHRAFAVLPERIDAGMFVTATVLRDGRVLVAGGYDEQIRSTARAWLVTP